MNPRVYILVTCRKPELLPMSVLVFKSLRTGFPTAEVRVFLNNVPAEQAGAIADACHDARALVSTADTIHHEWIESLIRHEQKPFWIVDTDMIFYRNFEQFSFEGAALAGWRIPEFVDGYSAAVTRARLHTSLLYIDPVKVREAIAKFASTLPEGPFCPLANLIYPLCLPFKGRMYFHDTCSLLYHAIGGVSFTDEMKNAFLHFNFGTISDMVLPRMTRKVQEDYLTRAAAILKEPILGVGAWREQEKFYSEHQV